MVLKFIMSSVIILYLGGVGGMSRVFTALKLLVLNFTRRECKARPFTLTWRMPFTLTWRMPFTPT